MLKELREFKIGIDMRQSLEILLEKNIIEEDLFEFLNQARLLRNRISYRYKEPTKEELMEFIEENIRMFENVLQVVKNILK